MTTFPFKTHLSARVVVGSQLLLHITHTTMTTENLIRSIKQRRGQELSLELHLQRAEVKRAASSLEHFQ